MNDSDSIFDIQERVANCSDQLNKEGYWYFYDDFVNGIERKILNPISIILMNSSLLRKLNRQEKIIYERTTCTVEISIMESFKLLNTWIGIPPSLILDVSLILVILPTKAPGNLLSGLGLNLLVLLPIIKPSLLNSVVICN